MEHGPHTHRVQTVPHGTAGSGQAEYRARTLSAAVAQDKCPGLMNTLRVWAEPGCVCGSHSGNSAQHLLPT